MQILMEHFQMISISLGNYVAEYFFMKSIYGTKNGKRGVIAWYTYAFIRLCLYQFFFTFYLGRFYSEETWFKILSVYVMLFFSALFFILLAYVFEGQFLKIILYAFPLETIISCVSMACQYVVVGQINIRIKSGPEPKQIMLIWAGVLLAEVVFYLSYRILSPVLLKLRGHKIKHVKTAGFIIMVMYLIIIYGNTNIGILASSDYTTQAYTLIATTTIILGLLVLQNIFLSRREKKQTEYLNAYLSEMTNMTECMYEQRGEFTSTKEFIHQTLDKMGEYSKSQQKQELMDYYIAGMREKYKAISSGIYCENQRLDAYLITIEKDSRQRKIETEIHFQGYSSSIVEEKDMETILWSMAQIWNSLDSLEFSRKWFLYATEQKSNLIILARYESKKMDREDLKADLKECQKQLKVYLKKYNGVMTQNLEKEKIEIKMMLSSSV